MGEGVLRHALLSSRRVRMRTRLARAKKVPVGRGREGMVGSFGFAALVAASLS